MCELCICNIDPSCCTDEWTELCGVKAGQFCAVECSCIPLLGGDCCQDGFGNPGCGDIGCQDCVCEQDDFCCSVAWDLGCIGVAGTLCLDECNCEGTSSDRLLHRNPWVSRLWRPGV